ncbi:hypothetical protein H0H92_008936 [Tricholoma furcatifolium]|nr:hypothetical protein H0H92_008936 [Tricholoma furcatifolium]
MRFFTTAFAAAAALIPMVSAEIFTVMVGQNQTVAYSPTRHVGDVVNFQFLSKNHTVTQSSFANPCTPLAGGVDSGFQPVATNATSFPQFSITITNTSTPFWFFCEQTGHCGKGMVFAINPTVNKTFAAFQANAIATASNTTTTTTGSTTVIAGAAGATASADGVSANTGSTSSASASTPATTSGARILSGNSAAILATLVLVAGLVL